jgi:hypothetical protein
MATLNATAIISAIDRASPVFAKVAASANAAAGVVSTHRTLYVFSAS